MITADDLGCQLSCYGEKRFSTPRLDALAAEGVRFENFYVAQSSCSPSRAALLTGRWPHQNGQVGLAHLGFRLHPGQPNMTRLLKDAGYRTGIIGKLHVEPVADFPWDWMPAREKMAAGRTREVRWVANQSREFIASAKAAGKPFFYYVNFFDPHGPYVPGVNQVDGFPERPLNVDTLAESYPMGAGDGGSAKESSVMVANTIRRLDAGIGLLLEELKLAGVAENTVVVFLGDNGLPVQRGKTTSYEQGVRVPLLVRWPGVTKAGQVRRELVSALDLMPTIMGAASVGAPAGLAGQSITALLRGESVPWREFLFTEMNYHVPDTFKPQRTVRDVRHKLLLNLDPTGGQPAVELFDLETDPGERKNLADDRTLAATRARLEQALRQWQRDSGDPLLDPARVQRWKAAAIEWANLPRVQVGPRMVVKIPEGGLDALR